MNEITKLIATNTTSIFKKCHHCFKSKPLKEFRWVRYKAWEDNSNYCFDCESNGHYGNSGHGNDPTIKNFNKMRYTFAWIGKIKYKDLCKIYNIRYSCESLIKEVPYSEFKQLDK